MTLPRQAWVKLNRLRTGVGLFPATINKLGMASTPICEYGAKEKYANHIIASCSTHHHCYGALGLVKYLNNFESRCSNCGLASQKNASAFEDFQFNISSVP